MKIFYHREHRGHRAGKEIPLYVSSVLSVVNFLFLLCISLFFVFLPFSIFASIDQIAQRVKTLESQEKGSLILEWETLLFKAAENGLPYAVSNKTTSKEITDGHIKNVKIPYQWGFRFGIGGKIPNNQWELLLEWTHFHGDSSNRAVAPLNGALFPIWINPLFSSGEFVEKARARWRLHLGIVDAEIGNRFSIGRWFQLKPYFGLRSAWIRQKFLLDYSGGTFVPNGQDKLHMKNKFWGLG